MPAGFSVPRRATQIMGDELLMKKLTPEIIEACLDRDLAEIGNRSDEEILDTDLWREVALFTEHVLASEIIQSAVFAIAISLCDEPPSDHTRRMRGLTSQHLRKLFEPGGLDELAARGELGGLEPLVRSKKLTSLRLQVLIESLREFFFIGWHARGAVEEAEQIRKMTE
jgi:hypothetical protein